MRKGMSRLRDVNANQNRNDESENELKIIIKYMIYDWVFSRKQISTVHYKVNQNPPEPRQQCCSLHGNQF